MARNIVQEKREAERNKALAEADANEAKKTEEVKEETKIAVNQVEAVIINRLDILTALVLEGFKQCGVNFEEKKN